MALAQEAAHGYVAAEETRAVNSFDKLAQSEEANSNAYRYVNFVKENNTE